MLNVVFYNSNQELINTILGEHVGSPREVLVVCPSPVVADNLRSLGPEFEVLTISKWVGDFLKKHKLKRVKKAELLIKLAPVWRLYFPEGKFAKFMEAFELFTELRSFTLEIGLLSEFSSHLDEELQKSITIFWAYLISENLIDEQLSYQKVGELSALSESSNQVVYFVGFKHLGGVQIDMLKRLGEQMQIRLTFPRAVYQETLPNDWIRWVTGETEIKEPLEHDWLPLRKVSLPKGKTNLFLKKLEETFSSEARDVLFAGTQVDLINFQEVYANHTFFKTKENIFTVECENLITEFAEDFENHLFLDFLNFIEKIKEKMKIAISKGDYRKLKILQILKDLIPFYQEMNDKLDKFSLDVLFSVTQLNLPRTSLVTIEKEHKRQFLSISDMSFRDDSRALLVLATDAIGGFRAGEKVLAEELSKALKVLGPIKRTGLDYIFHKHEIISALKNPKTILAIEDKLLETETSWREILKNFQFEELDLGVDFKLKTTKDILKNDINKNLIHFSSYSATRLQTYYDCPRKFYFQHIEPFNNRPDTRSLIGPDELGHIEHETIKDYFEQRKYYSSIDLILLKKISEERFDYFLRDRKIQLNATARARAVNEVFQYAQNGILFLNDIIEKIEFKDISFEVSLPPNQWKIKGSIDCLIEDQKGDLILLDFKRSTSAIGTKKETQELHKLQLWIYLLCLKDAQKEVVEFGYVNLSDAELKEVYFEREVAKDVYANNEDELKAKVEGLIQKLSSDKVFEIAPRNEKVCNFCSVQLFCPKGGLDVTC